MHRLATADCRLRPCRGHLPQRANPDPPEAREVGLITRIAPDDELLEQALALGEQLASFPGLAMGLTRRMLQANATESDLNVLLGTERKAFVSYIKATRNSNAANTTIKAPQ